MIRMGTNSDEGEGGDVDWTKASCSSGPFREDEKRMGRFYVLKLIVHISTMFVLTVGYIVLVAAGILLYLDISRWLTLDDQGLVIVFIIIFVSLVIALLLLLGLEGWLARKLGLHKNIWMRDVNKDGIVNQYDDPRYRALEGALFVFIFGSSFTMMAFLVTGWVPGWFIWPPAALIIMFYFYRVAYRNRWELP